MKSDTHQLGSDEEFSMRQAMKHFFSNASLLVCTRHLKENTIRHMRDKVGMGTKIRNSIVHALFGEVDLSSVQDMATFQGQLDDALSNILLSSR